MNFLALCKRARAEFGASGTGPVTVVGQVGEMERIVNWVNDAYLDIQAAHPDWQWLRKSFSFVTTEGQASYTPVQCGVADLGQWLPDTVRCYPTASGLSGEMCLAVMDYDRWRDLYQLGATRSTKSRPVVVAVAPNTSLVLGPSPDVTGYTILGDYHAAPAAMVLDADVPLIPEKHQMAIVYRAMMAYASYNMAPEVYSRGEIEFNKIMRRMRQDRAPRITTSGSLA